jgi:transcriptional regulator with XRE-family HTH domain
VKAPNVFEPLEHLHDGPTTCAEHRLGGLQDERIGRELSRIGATLGLTIHGERRRRRLSLRRVAALARVSLGTAQAVEAGKICSLNTYVRLCDALRLKADFQFIDPRRRDRGGGRATDSVHAAMGEVEAAHFRSLGFEVGLDEPFQHYQFAERADVVAWSAERGALLHIENKTLFPDLQDSFGAFNVKRRYLGAELASGAGVAQWRSETHVAAALWSGEVLRAIRAHAASFAGVCPGPIASFETWWRGDPPATGRHSVLAVFDPAEGRRSDRRRWVGLGELTGARPRYREYADAVSLLGLGGG